MQRGHPRVHLTQVVVRDRGPVDVEDPPQLADRLGVHVHAEIHVGEGPVVEDQQGGGLLASVLPARVAPGLDRPQQALLEILGRDRR